MDIFEMKVEEVEQVLPLYIDYYNNYEGSCRTDETAGRRIRQVLRDRFLNGEKEEGERWIKMKSMPT